LAGLVRLDVVGRDRRTRASGRVLNQHAAAIDELMAAGGLACYRL
jgi:hypothetical protein